MIFFAKTLCMKKIDWSKVKTEGFSLIIVGHVCYHKDINNNYRSGFNYTAVSNKIVCKSLLDDIDSKKSIWYHLVHPFLIWHVLHIVEKLLGNFVRNMRMDKTMMWTTENICHWLWMQTIIFLQCQEQDVTRIIYQIFTIWTKSGYIPW